MLLNPQVEAFLVKTDAITDYVMKKYCSENGKITKMFQSVKGANLRRSKNMNFSHGNQFG